MRQQMCKLRVLFRQFSQVQHIYEIIFTLIKDVAAMFTKITSPPYFHKLTQIIIRARVGVDLGAVLP